MTIVKISTEKQDIAALMAGIGRAAHAAATTLAHTPTKQKDAALLAAAMCVRANIDDILTANADDVADAVKNGLAPAMIDRLTLDTKRVEAIARALEDIAALPDPVGTKIAEWDRPNGLHIERVRTPLGV
ncbi:MAG: gamma-glutamyl-phosphate reductase, partial [Parvibaculum sp.]